MRFRGEFFFLSNMYPCTIKIGERTFKCAESAFQAAKCTSEKDRKVFYNIDGFTAKKLGKKVKMRKDWNHKKVKIMKTILKEKFKDPELREKLLNIKSEIIEENTWNDKFWGQCKGEGKNILGKLLMEIREEINKGE